MKKLSLYFLKWLNNYINSPLTPEESAVWLYNYANNKDNPMHILKVLEFFEKKVELESKIKEKRCAEFCKSVNTKWTSEPVTMHYLEALDN